MIVQLIAGLVVLLVGVSIFPVLSKQVNDVVLTSAMNNSSTSGYAGTVLNLIPAFFALAIAGIAIAVTYSGLRNAGLMGGSEESELETRVSSETTHHDGEYIRVPQEAYTPKPKVKRTITTNHKEYERVYTDSGGKFD